MSEFPHFHLPVEKYYTHEDTSGQPPFMYFNQGNQLALEIGTNFELKDIPKRSRTPLKNNICANVYVHSHEYYKY